MRLAAVGDIHVKDSDKGKWRDFFRIASDSADVLLLCGDLTDTGKASEAEILAHELKASSIPVVAVLGNHDHEGDEPDQICTMMKDAGVKVLDGNSVTIGNVGIAGIKGFGGGFKNRMLAMFGEKMMKKFVQETMDQVMKLDAALMNLHAEGEEIHKIVIMHYAPIPETIFGEPEQIFPFLGSSRLEHPLNNRNVEAAFHGHAHVGTLEGRTSRGVKIFNVSVPVLHKSGFNPPFFIYEVNKS